MDAAAEPLEIADVGGFKFYVRSEYGPTISGVLRDGRYEGHERGVLPYLLKPSDRVIEIGSAIGVVGTHAAAIVGCENVVCFEANPNLISHALSNHALNGFSIETHNAVLQNRDNWAGPGHKVPFYINQEFWASSLRPEGNPLEIADVPTLCFEEQIEKWRANVLICDIEGGEIDLLTTADLQSIEKIVMEIHYHAGRKEINTLIKNLLLQDFCINFDLCVGNVVTLQKELPISRN